MTFSTPQPTHATTSGKTENPRPSRSCFPSHLQSPSRAGQSEAIQIEGARFEWSEKTDEVCPEGEAAAESMWRRPTRQTFLRRRSLMQDFFLRRRRGP